MNEERSQTKRWSKNLDGTMWTGLVWIRGFRPSG
jgi:hypothetical protein